MATRRGPEFQTKSDAIRQYLRDRPDATVNEIVAALKAQGFLIPSALAAYIKYSRHGEKQQEAGPARNANAAAAGTPAGDNTAAIRAAIAKHGQRFRPRDLIAAFASEGVEVSFAEVIAVAKSLGMRPRKQTRYRP